MGYVDIPYPRENSSDYHTLFESPSGQIKVSISRLKSNRDFACMIKLETRRFVI
jgi:hypothetical protein